MSICLVLTAREGRALAVKRATGVEACARLAAEADWLARAAHPGVVELVGFERRGDAAELCTVHAGRPASSAVTDDSALARMMASLAETVADLHDLGIVHGRIDRSHVVVGAGGMPRLCGFSGASSAVDGPASRADDVGALGRLLHELLAERRTGRRATARERTLARVASNAADPDPARRPTARAWAASLRALEPRHAITETRTRRSVTIGRPTDERRDTKRPLPGRRLALGCAAVLLVSAALARLSGGTPGHAPAVPADARGHERAEAQATTTAPVCASAPDGTTTGTRAITRDADGDRCPDLITVTGALIDVDGDRFVVGSLGDLATVGDWDCDGAVSPAVLRPTTGEVFTFPSWAEAGQVVEVRALDRVEGAARLVVEPAGGPCDALVVLSGDDERTVVWPPAPVR